MLAVDRLCKCLTMKTQPGVLTVNPTRSTGNDQKVGAIGRIRFAGE
jgi:hypothetical protein